MSERRRRKDGSRAANLEWNSNRRSGRLYARSGNGRTGDPVTPKENRVISEIELLQMERDRELEELVRHISRPPPAALEPIKEYDGPSAEEELVAYAKSRRREVREVLRYQAAPPPETLDCGRVELRPIPLPSIDDVTAWRDDERERLAAMQLANQSSSANHPLYYYR